MWELVTQVVLWCNVFGCSRHLCGVRTACMLVLHSLWHTRSCSLVSTTSIFLQLSLPRTLMFACQQAPVCRSAHSGVGSETSGA